ILTCRARAATQGRLGPSHVSGLTASGSRDRAMRVPVPGSGWLVYDGGRDPRTSLETAEMISGKQIREMARDSAVEVTLICGRTVVIVAPEHVGCSPDGDLVALASGEGIECFDSDEIAQVRVVVPDPEVERLRAGEVPLWMMDRMRLRPE